MERGGYCCQQTASEGREEKCVKVGILLLFSGWEQKQTEQGPVRWSARAPEWLPPWVGMAIGGVELGFGWVLEAGCMGPTHIRHVYQSLLNLKVKRVNLNFIV